MTPTPSLLVKKRDGSKEKFKTTKISRVLVTAGMSRPKAVALSHRVLNWAVSQKKDHVSSLDIRDRVIKELETERQHVSDLYRWYQKTKDLPHHPVSARSLTKAHKKS